MEDKVLICADCGNEFTFSVRDQEFYQEKGYKSPKRCHSCRDKKKQRVANEKEGNYGRQY
jgi:hypothetical protein